MNQFEYQQGQDTQPRNSHSRHPQQSTGSRTEPKTIIYFAGVPKDLKEPQLVDYLSQFGDVSWVQFKKSNKSSDTQRHRGCGEAEFRTPKGAKKAISKIHKFQGREFLIRYYVDTATRRRQERLALDEQRKAFVAGVPLWYTRTQLLAVLNKLDKVKELTITQPGKNAQSATAFVVFTTPFILEKLMERPHELPDCVGRLVFDVALSQKQLQEKKRGKRRKAKKRPRDQKKLKLNNKILLFDKRGWDTHEKDKRGVKFNLEQGEAARQGQGGLEQGVDKRKCIVSKNRLFMLKTAKKGQSGANQRKGSSRRKPPKVGSPTGEERLGHQRGLNQPRRRERDEQGYPTNGKRSSIRNNIHESSQHDSEMVSALQGFGFRSEGLEQGSAPYHNNDGNTRDPGSQSHSEAKNDKNGFNYYKNNKGSPRITPLIQWHRPTPIGVDPEMWNSQGRPHRALHEVEEGEEEKLQTQYQSRSRHSGYHHQKRKISQFDDSHLHDTHYQAFPVAGEDSGGDQYFRSSQEMLQRGGGYYEVPAPLRDYSEVGNQEQEELEIRQQFRGYSRFTKDSIRPYINDFAVRFPNKAGPQLPSSWPNDERGGLTQGRFSRIDEEDAHVYSDLERDQERKAASGGGRSLHHHPSH